MALLSLKEIIEVDDLKTETVSVPEWGGEVCVRCLKGWQRDQFESWAAENVKDLAHYRAKLVSLALCDENGESLNATEADMLKLSDKNAAALNRVFTVAQRLSGMGKQDVEDIEKNLKDQSGSSGSS